MKWNLFEFEELPLFKYFNSVPAGTKDLAWTGSTGKQNLEKAWGLYTIFFPLLLFTLLKM